MLVVLSSLGMIEGTNNCCEHFANAADPVKADMVLVFLMKAETFLVLLLRGSSFSESDRTL